MEDELISSVIGLVCLSKWFYRSCKGCKGRAPLFSVTSHSSQSSLWDACFLVVLFISVADPDMGPGFRVHEIPFQFNLMKLLPRCQQVEMFFLMLTKGRYLFTTCLPLSSLLWAACAACLSPWTAAYEHCRASFSSSMLFFPNLQPQGCPALLLPFLG